MTASWDSFGPGRSRRRIRGGEIPPPNPVRWREARRHARAQALAAQAALRAPREDATTGVEDVTVKFGPLGLDLDAAFAFGIVLPMIFMVQFASLGAAVISGLTPIYLFVRRKQLQRVLIPRAIFYVFPLLAVVSTVWSVAPKDTLRYALEFSITLTAALLISSARNQAAVLRAIALAFLIYVADAVFTGQRVAVGVGAGGMAFSGLTESKNLMADIASTGLIVSVSVIVMSLRDRKWAWVALCGAACLLDLYCIVAARSAGAMVGLALGLAPIIGLAPLLRAGKILRAALTGAVALTMLVVGLFHNSITAALMGLSSTLFQKDSTLTGRTYLWYRASDLIHQRPVLGQGYMSFWLQGNMDAEGLWQWGGIAARSGFSFHNTLVDMLVMLGWTGAAVLIVTVLIGAIALVRRFVERPSLALVFWIGVFLYEVSRTPIETLGIQPFAFTTTFVWGAMGAAFGRIAVRRAAYRSPRGAAAIQVWPVNYASASWANPRLTPERGSLRLLRKAEEVVE